MGTLKRTGLLLAVVATLTVSVVSSASAAETGYNPNNLPTVGCFWTGPFSASDEKTNLAYPGTEITYWGAKFTTPVGATLTLRGRYPHARYSSLNAYRSGGVSTGSLSGTDIKPDKGSINPSRPGKNRNAKNRDYTVSVFSTDPPANPAKNALYAAPSPGSTQDILYRVYVPDKGRSLAGGTGIPKPELKLADGTVLTGQALCDSLNSTHDYQSNKMNPALYSALVNTPGKDPATNPALPTFTFSKYFNLTNSLARYGSPESQQTAWANNPNEEGTQYNNGDARYMTGAYAFQYGQVLALHGKLPTTPMTYKGQKKTKAGQLTEWDMCGIQSLVTTKTYRCLFDEQIPLRNKKRSYVIAFAKSQLRPKNATRQCGVAWLPADPEGDGAGRPDTGLLLTRNVLPTAGYKKSSWSVTSPFNAAEIMGDHYPKGDYMAKKAFESHGCPFKWK